MKKIVKKIGEKYVTEKAFEKAMLGVAQSFARIEGSLEIMVKEFRNLHQDNKYFRDTISSFVSDVSLHDRRIESLTIRVEKLESKSK